MNPVWAFFFKDKYRTPFSVYKMSFAELIVLVGAFVGAGYGISLGISKLLELEGATEEVVEEISEQV